MTRISTASRGFVSDSWAFLFYVSLLCRLSLTFFQRQLRNRPSPITLNTEHYVKHENFFTLRQCDSCPKMTQGVSGQLSFENPFLSFWDKDKMSYW